MWQSPKRVPSAQALVAGMDRSLIGPQVSILSASSRSLERTPHTQASGSGRSQAEAAHLASILSKGSRRRVLMARSLGYGMGRSLAALALVLFSQAAVPHSISRLIYDSRCAAESSTRTIFCYSLRPALMAILDITDWTHAP